MHAMTFYTDTPDVVVRKIRHIKRIGGRVYHAFVPDLGDVPCGSMNEITNKIEPAVNPRGRAYGLRNALRYRRRPVKYK